MTEQAFNFGAKQKMEKLEKTVDHGLDLSSHVPERKQDVDEITVKLLDIAIDSFQTIPSGTPDKTAKIMISRKIQEELKQYLTTNRKNLSAKDKRLVHDNILNEIFNFGPLTVLLDNPNISEIMVNGYDNIFIESKGKLHSIPIVFRNNDHVFHTIDKIIAPLGRRVDESSPMVDARLPDGSRVNIIIPPLALNGPTITIRKFAKDPFTLDDLISMGTLSAEMYAFLKASIRGKMNVIISGGTGSGKTTLLNVLSGFIPENERIVTIEDAAELQLQQKHVVTLESRPANVEGRGQITIRDLVSNALRMRPDRIIVGEVRGGETLDMLQAMNTGHDGSITTVHANTPRDSLSRMETLVHMSGVELPSKAIREQISSALHLIIQASRFPDGSRKISRITEITGIENNVVTMQDIFIYKRDGFGDGSKVTGKHIPTGIVPSYLDKLKNQGEYVPVSLFAQSKSVQQRKV